MSDRSTFYAGYDKALWGLTGHILTYVPEHHKTCLHAASPRWVCNASLGLGFDGNALSDEKSMEHFCDCFHIET